MPYTERYHIEQPLTGSNIDTWGEIVNGNMNVIDEAIAGILSFSISGDKALVYTNDSTDESHFGIHNITSGSGGRVILQPIEGRWIVRNGSAGNVIYTINGSTGTSVSAGSIAVVISDGSSSVYQVGPDGNSTKEYIDTGVQAAKDYALSLSYDAIESEFPGQAGQTGKFLQTNGSTPSWQAVAISDVTDLATTLAQTRGFAIAAAAIL